MSKQLAISSSFSTFALAALAVLHMPSHDSAIRGDSLIQVQAESPIDNGALDLPSLSFFAD